MPTKLLLGSLAYIYVTAHGVRTFQSTDLYFELINCFQTKYGPSNKAVTRQFICSYIPLILQVSLYIS